MKKALLYFFSILILGISGLLIFVKTILPNVGQPEDVTAISTPETIARGKYLAHAVAVCMDCHSTRDWSKFSGPLVEGTLGKGGEEFSQKYGFPGKYFSKNLTPFALKNWTDGEVLRAISSGVNKDGKALFPIMPHPNYGKLDKKDLLCIIAYLRTLEPIESEIPASTSDFPMNFILNTIPKKASFSQMPDPKDQLEYGAYLFTAASCNECHTKQDKGTPIAGMELAGGFEFPLPYGGIVRSANITPDKETGIGNWSERLFVSRFKMYADSSYSPPSVEKGAFNSMMPWTMYADMKDDDLKAIYAYLMTQKPISNKVVKFSK